MLPLYLGWCAVAALAANTLFELVMAIKYPNRPDAGEY